MTLSVLKINLNPLKQLRASLSLVDESRTGDSPTEVGWGMASGCIYAYFFLITKNLQGL